MNTQQLRERIESLPEPPEGERFSWSFRRKDVRRKIATDDPSQFLTWPMSLEALFAGTNKDTRAIFQWFLDNDPEYLDCAIDPGFGGPQRINGAYSGQYLAQLLHLHKWKQWNPDADIENMSIVEWGGGYGSMVVVARRMGFKGKYCIYDFPEFSVLQEYYLSNVDYLENVIFRSVDEGGRFDVPLDADLVIGLCSLSETPVITRNAFLNFYPDAHMLIVYQPNFYQVDNQEYFQGFARKFTLDEKPWSIQEIKDFSPGHWRLLR